jgi:hypothetical protein
LHLFLEEEMVVNVKVNSMSSIKLFMIAEMYVEYMALTASLGCLGVKKKKKGKVKGVPVLC